MKLLEGKIYGESLPKGFGVRGGGSSSFLATKMKGIFKGFKFISQIFVFKEPEMVIGYPTDVKHVAHIGYSSSSNIPSWMAEFNTTSDFSSGVLEESRGLSWASHGFRMFGAELLCQTRVYASFAIIDERQDIDENSRFSAFATNVLSFEPYKLPLQLVKLHNVKLVF